MRTHCPWYAGCTPLMDLVIPSMGPGALLSTGLMRCPDVPRTLRTWCIASDGPGALLPTGRVRCPGRAAYVDRPRALPRMRRMRYPRCAGLAAPGIPAAGSDISAAGSDMPAAFPLAYPPQALTCRLHSSWHARRIAVIGWLHCPDMRKPPFEMYRMVSKGGFRTEMALVMCFINGLKRTGCFQTAVFAHCTSALLVRKRLVGVSASCWCAGALPVCGARRAGQDEWCWV